MLDSREMLGICLSNFKTSIAIAVCIKYPVNALQFDCYMSIQQC